MEESGRLSDDVFESVFVARQPIFNRDLRIWGYELLFRNSGVVNTAEILDQDQATAKVIADGFVLAASGVGADKRLLINFPRNLLLREVALALPTHSCVIEILETVKPDEEIMEVLRKNKEAGYTLALDDFVGQPGYEPIIALADIVKVEVLNQSAEDIRAITRHLKMYNCKLLAEKVEDKDTLDFLMGLGYHYFQGYYFSKPEIVPGRKISSSTLAKMQMLQELAREDCDFGDLGRIISTDVSLSYRLLNYLNSPAFGLSRTIDSINQAITILGIRNTRQWLMVVTLSDLNPSPRVVEIGLQCVQRGRFFEQLVVNGYLDHSAESMFLLGLLSRLDALLGQHMKDILKLMPLEEEIKVALSGGSSSLRFWLNLAEGIENGDWATVREHVNDITLDEKEVALLHNQASTWAQGIFCCNL